MTPREDLLLRVLYDVVRRYEQAIYELGGDSELLRDAMRIARQVLQENNWWPPEKLSPTKTLDVTVPWTSFQDDVPAPREPTTPDPFVPEKRPRGRMARRTT